MTRRRIPTSARSAADAPDIDGKVYFKAPEGVRVAEGSFVDVKVREAVDYDLYGFAVSSSIREEENK